MNNSDPTRPVDPFAKLSQLGADQKLFAQERTQKVTSKLTQERDVPRKISRDTSRNKIRGSLRGYPTRDEIQEFSFRLRDDLRVKVQAEVPHEWQDELEEIARVLDVKKLELYRYIIGAFLGKVKREDQT